MPDDARIDAFIAAEEARGLVRWLRPESQNPQATAAPTQSGIKATPDEDDGAEPAVAATNKPQPWPKEAVEQMRAMAGVLASSPIALDAEAIASRFTARGPWKKRLPQLLQMLGCGRPRGRTRRRAPRPPMNTRALSPAPRIDDNARPVRAGGTKGST